MPPAALDDLQRKLALQEQRLTALEAIVVDLSNRADTNISASNGDGLPPEITRMLGDPAASAAMAQQLAALQQRLAGMEEKMMQDTATLHGSMRALYALGRLEENAVSGRPYAEQLTILEQALTSSQTSTLKASLQQLHRYAEDGLTSPQQLIEMLDRQIPELLRQANAPGGDASAGHSSDRGGAPVPDGPPPPTEELERPLDDVDRFEPLERHVVVGR